MTPRTPAPPPRETKTPIWFQLAACQGADTEIFFSTSQENEAKARAICAVCPVVKNCLDYANRPSQGGSLARTEYGFWGGQSENERCGRLAGGKRVRLRTDTMRVAPPHLEASA